jgi:Ca-activated chloride channel homolog
VELVESLAASRDLRIRKWKAACLVLSVSLLLVALARPQLGGKLTMTTRRGVDVLVALDISQSMLAEDMKPTRLAAAKREISSLFGRLRGDRVGLVIFAGAAFVQCPLTLDYQAAQLFLDNVDIDSIPVPGTAVAKAIERATDAFPEGTRKHKVLLLVTDGEDHIGDPLEAARRAKKEGLIIHAIGLGTPEGEPIPVRDEQGRLTGHLKGSGGDVVLSRLDETTLQRVALSTGGTYHRATAGQMELDAIYEMIEAMEEKTLADRLFTQYEERFQYPLFFAWALLLLGWGLSDRRREVVTVAGDTE